MNLEKRIEAILRRTPGLKGSEIAEQLEVDSRAVNECLNEFRATLFIQDKASYLWRLKGPSAGAASTNSLRTTTQQETELAKLCRYYLDCLSQEAQADISVPARGIRGTDYVELDVMPLADDDYDIFESEEARQLLKKARRSRNRTSVYLGYPIRLRLERSGNGWEGFKVEPVCLWTLRDDTEFPEEPPDISDDLPCFNSAVLRRLAQSTGNFLDEAIALSRELGMSSADQEPPEIDELFRRLHSARLEWDWKEEPDIACLSRSVGLSALSEEGIYNRAVLIVGERSPYTLGLEDELDRLSQLPEECYAETALGHWLAGKFPQAQAIPEEPPIEVLPLNAEQREAVQGGMSSPLTVITGPPGTGKSQVVTSLLINAAWLTKKVLFASKNNKAVDVVEARCNRLGSRPILLRVGSNAYQARLVEYVESLLAATATPDDDARFKVALNKHNQLRQELDVIDQQMQQLIQCRNKVDDLEQEVEPLRTLFGETCFRRMRGSGLRAHADTMARLKAASDRTWPAVGGFFAKLHWALVKKNRLHELTEAAKHVRSIGPLLGLASPSDDLSERSLPSWRTFIEDLDRRFKAGALVVQYFEALAALQSVQSPEVLTVAVQKSMADLNKNSVTLWDAWLRLQPSRLSQSQRAKLGRYVALLRMILAGNKEQSTIDKSVYREYYRMFPEVAGYLGCWAVTSLSVRRVPFEAAFFDLVVIDEASQCDIASALPLLYRAKSAVIIGDSKQLRHISSVTLSTDSRLAANNGLVGGKESWMYSKNSLFDLSVSICPSSRILALRDHHRSHAEIIEFSNKEFYGENLRIATRYDRLKSPHGSVIRWIDVRGQVTKPTSGSRVNEVEARAVVEELKKVVLEQCYRGTVGVVSPFRAHANRIRELVAQDVRLERALMECEFLVDVVHSFQGDERDLIIFSTVVSNGMTPGGLRFLKDNGYLFNVAITRARAALIAVGDLHAAQQCGVDYLGKFALYAVGQRSVKAAELECVPESGPEYPQVACPELVSPWEHVLYAALYAAGLHPIPQYKVEKYVLDFAIVVGDRRLNVEVDGENYHRNWDGELCRRDQIRNLRLIELGWDVMRFWVYQVRDELPMCVERVKTWVTTIRDT